MGALGTLIPLFLFFGFLGVFAWVGYEMYLYTNQLADRGVKHLEKKNITYTKDGLKVGVKQVKDEDISDKSQSVLVKAWNLASFPGYKSRIWNTDATPNFERTNSGSTAKTSSGTSSSRPAVSRTSTGTSTPSQR